MNKPTTAATVRAYFQAEPKRLARLSEAAQATVVKGARGAMHPQAVKVYNKGRKPERQYVVGGSKAAAAATAAQRASLVAQGLAGKRGPLSKAALASLKG